jgi:hypothetical protein
MIKVSISVSRYIRKSLLYLAESIVPLYENTDICEMTRILPRKFYSFDSFLLLLMITLIQCDTPSRPEEEKRSHPSNEDQMFTEVMRIHDEAMARMGELHRVKKGLEELKLEMNGKEDIEKEITLTIEKIDAADEGMFEWMAAFKDPRSLSDKSQVTRALEAELDKVRKVAEAIDRSIQTGDSLIVINK